VGVGEARARESFRPPAGDGARKAEQDYQKGEIERSLRFCRASLGLERSTSRPED
jgi:hypothetical protein